MKIRKNVLMLPLIAMFLLAMTALPIRAQTAVLDIYPQYNYGMADFSIVVRVNYVEEMFGYQYVLIYDTDVLTATGVTPNPNPFWWKQGPQDPLEPEHGIGWEINDAEGYVAVWMSYKPPEYDGFDHSDSPWTITTIDFTVDAAGASPLALVKSKISDIYGGAIAHTVPYLAEFRSDLTLPLAWFSMDPGGDPYVGDTIAFTSLGTDLDGTIVAWNWDFGDGDSATGETTTHVYTAPDLYTVTLTVTDNDGKTDTHSRKILIAPIPPPGAELLTAYAEYRKVNVRSRDSAKLFAEAKNLDEEAPVLVRMMIFVYGEGMANLGTLETEATIGAGETMMFEWTFVLTDWGDFYSDPPRGHPRIEWSFRAECWYNDFDLPTGEHHWAQVGDPPYEPWFTMLGKLPGVPPK